jgi:tryptophan 7-halogenase
MSFAIHHLVIAGDGVVAWWAAVFLKKNIPDIKISLVVTPGEKEYAVTASSDLLYLLNLVGISAQQLIFHADGNLHSACAYFGWHSAGQHYFHSDENAGLSYGIIDFNQWLVKLAQSGKQLCVDDYLLSSAAAKQGRVPPLETLNQYRIGCSFDPIVLCGLLENYARSLGVDVLHQEVIGTTIDSSGFIDSLTTAQGIVVQGDFYLDASGEQALLMRALSPKNFESWAEYFPCDKRKILVTEPRSERLIPFSSIQMGSCGWIKNIPLRTKVISELIYPNELDGYAGDDSMMRIFNGVQSSDFTAGCRPKSWLNNCLALGRSAVTADYFSHPELYMAAVSLRRFVDYWPSQQQYGTVADEFNRLMLLEFEALRDFHCVHYLLANKSESGFSRKLGDLQLPDSLLYRISLFLESGRGVADEATIIHLSHWIQLFLGLGCWPASYDVIADTIPLSTYEAMSDNIQAHIHQQIAGLPEYNSYLRALLGLSFR